MKVSEVKAIAPLADIYELRPDAQYLVVVNPATVPLNATLSSLREMHLKGMIICVKGPLNIRPADQIQFFDLSEKQP